MIDLDPQANSSPYLLGEQAPDAKPSIATFCESALSYSFKEPKFESFIHGTEFENLDIVPSHADLDALTGKPESGHKIYKLRDALQLATCGQPASGQARSGDHEPDPLGTH